MKRRTRFAPTPNGPLHFGNFCNLIFTYWYARENNIELFLRIDDYDHTRCKDEYIENILRVFDILKIEFINHPGSVKEFKLKYGQQQFIDNYFERLSLIEKKYACECSRKDWKDETIYPRICLNKDHDFKQGQNQIRYNVTDESQSFYLEMGDFVLWRKEDIPSYQWVSICDDISMGITDIIRGEDLINSSNAQIYLAKTERLDFVSRENILYHPLVLDPSGEKLSKSSKSESILADLKSANGLSKLMSRFCKQFDLAQMSLEELVECKNPILRTN